MSARVRIAVTTVVGIPMLISGCGDTALPGAAAPHAASASPASPTSTQQPTTEPSPARTLEALSLGELRRRVLDAVRAETSVHLAVGNLNPPPTTEITQDYSAPGGDLEMVISVEPGVPAIAVRRVDGEVYLGSDGVHFQHVPADKVSGAEETPLTAQLRTDVHEDLTSLFAGVVKAGFAGADPSLGAGVARYDLQIDTAAWFGAAEGGFALGVKEAGYPKVVPARLWLARTGLPVRLEVKYREPLNGVAGTGTVRIDYSRWSEPVEVERPAG